MNFAGPLMAFLWNLLPRRGQNTAEVLQYALHSFFWACVLMLVASQATHALDVYHHTRQEYSDAQYVYNKDQCATYTGPMQAKMRECSRLNMLLQTWPASRALIRVMHDWRLGLYQAVVTVGENMYYKLVLLLFALALCSYAWKMARCGKDKAVKAWRLKRAQETDKEMLARMGGAWNLLSTKSSTATADSSTALHSYHNTQCQQASAHG